MGNQWTSFNPATMPSSFKPSNMLLLTDGSVLIHNDWGGKDWFRLTPDNHGKYETGTWSSSLAMINSRSAFASGILKDGRVFVIGGEYSDDMSNNRPDGSNGSGYGASGMLTPLGEIFDPVTNTWSAINKPLPFNWILGDAPCCVLSDGTVLLGSPIENRAAIWDPVADTWREAGTNFGTTAVTKSIRPAEETWTLLPDGTVMTVTKITPQPPIYPDRPSAEKYIPSLDRWIVADQTPPTLTSPIVLLNLPNPSNPTSSVGIQEVGPSVLLPDGRLFAVGATGHTALYNMPTHPADPGSWTAGPDLPPDTSGNNYNSINGNIMTAIDAPAVLLPCGKVLCLAGPTVYESQGFWSRPSMVFVYDPAVNSFSQLNPQPLYNNAGTYSSNFLLLPTGQVLFTMDYSGQLDIFTPDPALLGSPQESWEPTITSCPDIMNPGGLYTISGTQFNGLSQACSFGDENTAATNYPIVRMTNITTNEVIYLRSFNFSTLGVATGSAIVSTQVQLPANITLGNYCLQVIANGISSDCVAVKIVLSLPRIDNWTEISQILFGIIQDGGGIEIVGGHIKPVPPRGPEIDILLSIASYKVAGLMSDKKERVKIQKASMQSIAKLAQTELSRLEVKNTKKVMKRSK